MSAPIEIPGVTLERLVARGTFSEVWYGQDLRLKAHAVAVKVATGEVGARMLRAEAALYRRMDGTVGIPRLLELRDGETPWIVLDWLGDVSFRDVLRAIDSASERGRALELFLEIVRVMANVHGMGIAHGDLKPENVVLNQGASGPPKPVILDFGLAREFQKERLGARLSESLKTGAGLEGGTLAYLPPEAVKGAEPSPAGDVYALGVMLHEALLGRRPDKAVSPEMLKRLLDPDIVDILCKALAFEPGDRYSTARAFLDALKEHSRALTATGVDALTRSWLRFGLSGLAAFFVVLRYVSVATLLVFYVGCVVACFGVGNPAPLIILVPFALLHLVVRWEGPETDAEATLRRSGFVVGKRR